MRVALKPRLTHLYYSVQVGKTLLWVAADLIAFYILVVVDKLSAGTVTFVLVGGLAWHAISDLAVGILLRNNRIEARRLAIIAGFAIPVAAASFVASIVTAPLNAWLALGFMMLFRSTYALFDIPHHALLGRMSVLGFDAAHLVSIRNLWGQIASVVLALSIQPWLGATASRTVVVLMLAAVASVATLLSVPIVVLLRQLWDRHERIDGNTPITALPGSALSIAILLIANLLVTVVVSTATKTIVGNVQLAIATPGIALAALTIGKLVSCIPLPQTATRDRIGTTFFAGIVALGMSVALVIYQPSFFAFAAFGLASGWVNILTWSWISQVTLRAETFAVATMTTKLGLIVSVPIAAMIV
ncbi:hypothetical protein [Sphingomonas sp. 10B4]|uniref:hypothetical protein n=1 Tax=Sphingomonas sp. 10B4 TaxID=3048575 RepID=UPI002AB4284F|nr:hypothetical protein [Sphingomonas sp. 10B4]MDY7526191.1 hypothetical protein [Sphingomonas sp. 10B4]MEB0284355.1 hypothetical protein [Sphingomonas sp. 10B4]